MQPAIDQQFATFARAKLDDHMGQISRCAGMLAEDQIWLRANGHCNSVGNLLLHLRGNVNQWIIGGVGGKTVTRDRPAEFAQRGGVAKKELIGGLEETVAGARDVIAALPQARWADAVTIQGYETTMLAAVFHVVEHFAFHTGQIVQMTKAILDVDLSLYDRHGQRLDRRASAAP